jgi:4-diphosphocytidyl-2-C-methyl-D-erythritol kinase
MIVFPNAKINIGLNVVSKREDGYHNLETIFFPLKLADALEFVEADETKLTTSGLQIDGTPDQNLILKAYHLLKADINLPPATFPFTQGYSLWCRSRRRILRCSFYLNDAQRLF